MADPGADGEARGTGGGAALTETEGSAAAEAAEAAGVAEAAEAAEAAARCGAACGKSAACGTAGCLLAATAEAQMARSSAWSTVSTAPSALLTPR